MGATFKEDVEDIRNSKVADVINELKSYNVNVDVIDPRASSEHLKSEYGFGLVSEPANDYDAIIVAVNHKEYADLPEDYFLQHCNDEGLLVDLKGLYRGKLKKMQYWSL